MGKKKKNRRPTPEPENAPGARDPLPAVAMVAMFAGAAGFLFLLRRFYHDDAYIALRYAQSLLDGHGIVWNVGERVEGYTSLLWVLATAGLGTLGLELETASRLLGVSSLAGLLFLLIKTQGRAGLLAGSLLAVSGPIVAWSLGGLETVGFTLLVTAAMLGGERIVEGPATPARALGVGLVFGLAELCRPEALLFLVPLMGLLLLRGVRSRSPGLPLAILAGFAPIFLTRLAWRVAYYGDWLPNTFYVKVPAGLTDVTNGVWYLLGFLLFYPGFLLLGAFATQRSFRTPLSTGERVMGASLLLYLVYLAWIGGDHMQWYRFIVPVLPVSILLGCRRLVTNREPRAVRRALTVVAVVCGLNVLSTLLLAGAPSSSGLVEVMKAWKYRDPAAGWGRLVGRYIHDRWPEDALVALNTAGSTAYFSERRCIDMLGLNDRQIAHRPMPTPPEDLPWARLPGHRKGDGAYVLSRDPDFIILGGAEGDAQPWFVGGKELLQSPSFVERYRLREAPISMGRGRPPFVFRYYERHE